jgi:hypothetical protein
MDAFSKLATTLAGLPIEQLAMLLALAVVCVAGYAIHAIYSVAKKKDR